LHGDKDELQEPLQEVLSKLVSQLEASREAAEEREKRDRLAQSQLEYWKARYDLAKHFMTLSLAAVAAFGALLGSAFIDPTVWDPSPWVLGAVYIPLERNFVIGGTFLCFIYAAIFAGSVAGRTRANIRRLGKMVTSAELAAYEEKERKGTSLTNVMEFVFTLLFFFGLIGLFAVVSGTLWGVEALPRP
jgi:hypothetical protein